MRRLRQIAFLAIAASAFPAWSQPGSAREERGGSAPRAQAGSPNSPVSGTHHSSLDLRLKLPYPEGSCYEVFQGNEGTFSHSGLNSYAWDFGLPEGTDVLAAASGRVVRIKQDSDAGGTAHEHYSCGNTVVLDHGNGLFSQYLHLRKNGVTVREGQLVKGGQLLAKSGNTGFSSTPHLHFQVQNALGQSLPARFVDVPGNGIPRSGHLLFSGNDGQGMSAYAGESNLPQDVFANNGVRLETAGLPAHLLRTDRVYNLKGKIAKAAKQVAIYVMKPDGGAPLHIVYCPVNPLGQFTAELDFGPLRKKTEWCRDTNQSNSFALAIAPVASDGSFWSSFSVPVTAR